MNRFKKILFTLFITLALVCNVNATIKEGDTITVDNKSGNWIVTNATEGETCNLDKNPEETVTQAEAHYEDSFGYTYENTCLEIGTKSQNWCSEVYAEPAAGCDNPDSTEGQYIENSSDTEDTLDFKKILISATNNVVKIAGTSEALDENPSVPDVYTGGAGKNGDGYPGGGGDEETVGDGSYSGYTKGTGKVTCSGFIDYYDTVKITVTWGCAHKYWGTCGGYTEPDGTYVDKYACEKVQVDSTGNSNTFDVGGLLTKCELTKCEDYIGKGKEKATCPEGQYVFGAKESDPQCSDAMHRFKGTTTVKYCAKSGPTKVEAFTYKLTIHGKNMDKEAYCINPSYAFNSSYKWDTTFKSSKCYDSLHRYNTKTNELEFDLECGYVYIIAEAKRINAAANKEVFSYSVISTAMRLYGTGITSKENGKTYTLPIDEDLTEFLQAGGYYTNYYGWGKGEYVGIPAVIKAKDTSWPSIYRYFMPKFYSIYIHTADVAFSYLKSNYRYTDVGNEVCDDNDTSIYCITGVDGKRYNVNADDYLNHRECTETFKNCSSSSIDLLYNEGSGRIGTFPYVDGFGIQEFLTSDIGQESTCTDESGLGVLCGLKNESILGAEINDKGVATKSGNISDSDYIDAIYLYIRALQGNKIQYEKKIEDALNQYTPVEGLTKVINDGGDEYFTIRYTIDNQETYENADADCTSESDQCKAIIYVYDSANNLVAQRDHYDYCKKNYCYVKVSYENLCKDGASSGKLHTVVVTDPNLEVNAIKKIGNGGKAEQILYVYDDTGDITGGFCQEIDALSEDVKYKCLCDPKEKSNTVEANGNIKETNYCSNNYSSYDELYYGDPSMSTILNACYDEDKLKYEYTDDLNANGNDIVHDGEQPMSKYSYQLKSDDFDVCQLYCRQESRAYLANKTAVRAGMALKYDIGQALIDKKIINETASQLLSEEDFKKNNYLVFKYKTYDEYTKAKEEIYGEDRYSTGNNLSPIVILEFMECTSTFDSEKWTELYNNAGTDREKNQLIYSAYNCNLYTTADIQEAIDNKDIPDILGLSSKDYPYKENGYLTDSNSWTSKYAEPAMIDYSYSIKTGKTTIVKNWGTTKDYLLAEEQKACESIGLDYASGECGVYNVIQYENDYFNKVGKSIDKTYLNTLGVDIQNELSLVDSNLNKTIYCSGESCYKLPCGTKDGEPYYCYNPNPSGKLDYTVVTAYDNKTESGNILSYSEWGTDYSNYTINGKTTYKYKTIGGYKIPTNDYSSFTVVTALGAYNNKTYYAENYTGLIKIMTSSDSSVSVSDTSKKSYTALDKNVFPLHLDIEAGNGYTFKSKVSNFRTAYNRSTYYVEKNYNLYDNLNFKIAEAPNTFEYICTYDVYNINQKDNSVKGYTYRIVDLDDVFASVTDTDDKSLDSKLIYNDGTNLTRNYPENWSTEFSQNVLSSIENSYTNILEPENNNDDTLSYLEYSYTITKEGLKKLKQYNDEVEKDGGYLNDTLYDCQYDSEEGIFYNCKSSFLEDVIGGSTLSAYSGDDLIIDNKDGANGLYKGESEYCASNHNINSDHCKYQKKGNTTGISSESETGSDVE